MARLISTICGETVIASYPYLACYEAGAILERHKDRKQCLYNLSLVCDMVSANGAVEPWPIYLDVGGKAKEVLLEVGDGLLYSGTDIWHWREALPEGQKAIICFYHFVPENFSGPLD